MLGFNHLKKTLSTPPPYTSPVLTLLTTDILLFLKLSLTWPISAGLVSIVMPFTPSPSGELDELKLTWENLKCDVVHTILFVAQMLFLGSLVVLLFTGLPAVLYLGWVVIFVLVNMELCRVFLNGPEGQVFSSGGEYEGNPEHEGERWVFVNGVAVGSHWMQSNLDRLALTFHRPLTGIHNPSYGIPFDVLECILQRTFSYPTTDIRNIYTHLSHTLASPRTTKLVLIAHSQGAIEVSLVLDWLYATLPRKEIAKLEVFTFGNAANHFNVPVDEKGPVISHVEHYVNDGDWVARFGVQHFKQTVHDDVAPNADATVVGGDVRQAVLPQTPILANGQAAVRRESTFEIERRRAKKHRFTGTMFKRTDCSGHQMNQHYLDNMFVLDKALKSVVDDEVEISGGAVSRKEGFMEMNIDPDVLKNDDTVVPLAMNVAAVLGQTANPRVQNGSASNEVKKVKHVSRLWQYRNGKTPEDWPLHRSDE